MPLDWSIYIPVICIQKDTKYDGQVYMEPIRNVVKLNGQSVSKNDNLKKCDFKSGDVVTILFQKSLFEGVVDFTREGETMDECTTGSSELLTVSAAASTPTTSTLALSVLPPSSGSSGIRSSVAAERLEPEISPVSPANTANILKKRAPRKRPRSQSLSRPPRAPRRFRRQSGHIIAGSKHQGLQSDLGIPMSAPLPAKVKDVCMTTIPTTPITRVVIPPGSPMSTKEPEVSTTGFPDPTIFNLELRMNSLESTMKLYFSLMEAKMEKLSVYVDRLFSCVEPTMSMLRMIDGKVVSLETMTGQLVQDMQGLKSRQDMLFVKQDRIQSTLSGQFPPIIRSPSSETAVAWSPSPRHSSMISPTCIYPSPVKCALAINATPSAVNPTSRMTPLAIDLTPTAPNLMPAAIDPTLLVASDHVNLGNSQPVVQQPFIPPFSPPMDIDAHSTVSIDDIESFFSIDWGRESKDKTTARSQSDPGFPLSQPIDSSCTAKKSQPALPSRVNSDSLIDPNVVLEGLSTVNIGYDSVGRIGVSLARFSFFGDDVLRISTLKGKGKRHVGLSPHKLEAMYSFLHQLDPFRSLNKKDFDLNVKNRVETALKDHLKSPANRSPVPKGFM